MAFSRNRLSPKPPPSFTPAGSGGSPPAARNRALTFVNPIPGGSFGGRVDQGIDLSGSPGMNIVDPIPGRSKLTNIIGNWFSGQPLYAFQVISGPFKGRFWYAAEQIKGKLGIGQTVDQGQSIGTYASSGTATEFGWAADPQGTTLSVAHGTQNTHPNHANTPEGLDFASKFGLKTGVPTSRIGGRSVRAPAGSGVSGWKVKASQESDGGAGSCGDIGTGGVWYSELSTVPMGTGSDFAALGKLPCMTALLITNPANGKSVTAHKRDVGAGSAFLPVMGLYPATARALGLSGGVYTVIISRPDGGPLHPVRGTQVSGAAAGSPTPITRPGGGASADTGQAVDKLFTDYEAKIKRPRTAPQGFTGNPFQWWWSSFSGK